jgi:hypothetical protein
MTRLRRVLLCWVCLGGIAATRVFAQTPAVPSDKLAWDMAQDTDGLSFLLQIDGGSKQPLSGATCSAPSNGTSVCQAALPPMTSGAHRLIVFATATVAGTPVESGPSNELSIAFVAIVTPTGLRLIKG